MNDLEFLIPVAFFAFTYGVFHLFVRRKERLALIDKGVTAAVFNSESNVSPSLKYGIFCIGIAIGFLLGEILAEYTHLNEGVAYLSMIFLFGGIGLVVYYFIAKKHTRKE
jgi:predicted MFS family arabinose efflux permease